MKYHDCRFNKILQVQKTKYHWIRLLVPWKKFRNAAVMKILNTLLKTSGSKNAVSDPEGLHAMMSMA